MTRTPMTPATDPADRAPPTHVLDIDDLEDPEAVLDRAAELKAAHYAGEPYHRLPDRTLAMLFERPSTRTRTSFETGMTRLGGHAIMISPEHTHLGRGEPIADTARALSCYVDAVMARVADHNTIAELAAHATVPVINGLSDEAHPCQTLADLLTVRETAGFDASVAWVGDGNNTARSFAIGCAMVGIDLTVATPDGYGLGEDVLERAADLGTRPEITTDPEAAVSDADVVYTDVWVSMGDEDERAARLEAFEAFQVDEDLLSEAPDPLVMHCLPAHRGEEITDAVLEGDRSVVWRQAENRMHAQNGLLVSLLGGA